MAPRYADPFRMHRDWEQHPWESEFGFGPGRFPDPRIDFSAGGSLSRIPIADPDRERQLLELAAGRRSDVADPNQPNPFSPYVLGNTDRYGAQPPLVVNTRMPKAERKRLPRRSRMQREW